jgi:uncharacterized membrane protein (DUF485 family)
VGQRAGIGRKGIAAIVLGGVLTHVVLMVSLLGFLHGWIGAPVLAAVQIVNMGVPLAVVLAVDRRGGMSAILAHRS